MKNDHELTEGRIYPALIRFAFPVLGALFLQSLYGAVDLLVVGRFSTSSDVAAVSNGAQIMTTLTNVMASLAMGTTILLGHRIGQKDREGAGRIIGASIMFFTILGAAASVLLAVFAPGLARIMKVPDEAMAAATAYLRICGGGMLIITWYNLIGSIFRAVGDSVTPLIAVSFACVGNIVGDLLLVGVFHMGAAGAAIATVASQAISVALSLVLISKKQLKVCAFIMLVPSAFMQSMAAFVSQNYGAGRMDRARRGLIYAIATSFAIGVVMSFVSFFHGGVLTALFSRDPAVVQAGWDYLKAYAIDCLLTPVFFCFIGFFNGIGKTRFVMVQGIIGSFLVRIPVSFFMSRQRPVSLFHIGLATPASSTVQIILCVTYFVWLRRRGATRRQG